MVHRIVRLRDSSAKNFVLVSIAGLLGLPIAREDQTYLAMFQDVAPIGAWTLVFALLRQFCLAFNRPTHPRGDASTTH